ncbi:MAG: hypothetical protein RO009_03525 [Pseudorhodoplanes sp.]|jgi:hypothetical protein|nr:hypothetical protein [Pseudorhodoplanes sp.]
MSEQHDRGAAGDADLLKRIQSLEKELRVLKRSAERPKATSFSGAFAMPPPPAPTTLPAAAPMMLAWMLSWLFSTPQSSPNMLESMARFAATRGDFWHHSFEALAAMAHQAAHVSKSGGLSGLQVSPEDKLKVKAVLEEREFPSHVIDSVLHAMNALDALQSYRDAAMGERHT